QWHLVDVGTKDMVRDIEKAEPKQADLGKNPSLVGYGRRQHPVERANAVGGDQQQFVPQVIDVSDLTSAYGKSRKLGRRQGGGRHGHGSSRFVRRFGRSRERRGGTGRAPSRAVPSPQPYSFT